MSSISAQSSPLQILQSQLQSSVSNGTINPSDQNALSGALTDIDSSLTASRSTDASAAPTDLKSKIDDLISQEASSGKLTSDQATELKSVFANAFGKVGAGRDGDGSVGGHHAGGHRAEGVPGAGGPPPASGADSGSDSSAPTSASDLLQQFLQSLQASLQSGSSNTYGAAGSSSTSSTSAITSILIDYKS